MLNFFVFNFIFFFIEISSFIQQECNKLSKSDSKNAVFQH